MQREATPTAFGWRTQRRLQRAEPEAHPFGTWLLEMGFDLWIRCALQRVIIAPSGFQPAPGSIIASNHQRDIDGPLLGTLLVQRHGLRFRNPLPYFATREDLFRPGILARLTAHWPRPWSVLLGRAPLAWFFPLGHAEPMRRVREFTLGEALRMLIDAGLGDAAAATLLNARGRRELGATGRVVLAQLVNFASPTLLEAWWGWRRLAPAARRVIADRFRATATAQLTRFSQHLERGRCVYFAPEGATSTDGRFGRVRAGCFRLAHLRHAATWIQPIALAYDALASGRTRVVTCTGRPFHADTTRDRRRFDATLRQAILDLVPITPSMLLARFLLHGACEFTREELVVWMAQTVRGMRTLHPSLDPLLATDDMDRLVHRRLRWLELAGLVVRRCGRFRNCCPRDVAPGWRTTAGIVRYLDNSLADLVPDIAQALPC